MRSNFARAFLISTCLAVGAAALPMPAMAAYEAPTVVTDPATGNVTVTLSNGTAVVVSASLAAQIVAAMNSGDAAAVTAAIKALVQANAANDPDKATAIYILAASSTTDKALQAAAYAGVAAGNPGAKTQLADNSPQGAGAPGGQGGGGGAGGTDSFPSGGTSGGGSTPSPNGP